MRISRFCGDSQTFSPQNQIRYCASGRGALGYCKFAKVFSRERNPLYGIYLCIYFILDSQLKNCRGIPYNL